MEIKKAKVIFANNGKGCQIPRITLPKRWTKELGITSEDKDVRITYTEGKIIIEKC